MESDYRNVRLFPMVPGERIALANSDWTEQINRLQPMTYHNSLPEFIDHRLDMETLSKYLNVTDSGTLFKRRADETKITDEVTPVYLKGSSQYVYNDNDRQSVFVGSVIKNQNRQAAMYNNTDTGVYSLLKN